jgi:antitoxin YokJ
MKDLLDKIRNTPDCLVDAPAGMPLIQPEHVLPNDLKEFYQLCGGLVLYDSSEYFFSIVPPQDFLLSNTGILYLDKESFPTLKDEISWSWYVIGKGDSGEYISIDLEPIRLGRCYFSIWETHAMKGYAPIIADTFTDLLVRLLANKGDGWYWKQPDFELRDAYDL